MELIDEESAKPRKHHVRSPAHFGHSPVITLLILAVFLFMWGDLNLSLAQSDRDNPRKYVDASSDNFPPMNILDEDGQLTGFGTELADAVIKALGGEITHIHSSIWTEVLEWLKTGEADFIHDTGYTRERDRFLDYTSPIMEMPEVIFVRPDQYDISDIDSLSGKTVACVNKHITHLYLKNFPEIKCLEVKTPVEGLYELVSGNVDAFVYPKQIVLYLAQNLRLADKIKITGEPLRVLTWSMVVKEGNRELLAVLNRGIAKVRESGEYDRIYDKWWGEKILAGYSKSELQWITGVTSGALLLLALSVALFFFNRKLKKGKKDLEREVFERKKMEVSLRESQNKYRDLVEESFDGIFIQKGPDIIFANRRLYEMLGYGDGELIGHDHWALYHPDYQKLTRERAQARMRGEDIIPIYEVKLQRKDKSWFYGEINAKAITFRHDDETGVQVWVKDINERKQAEKALQKSEKRFRNTFEQAAVGICHAKLNGELLRVNKRFSQIVGYPQSEMLLFKWQDITHRDDLEADQNLVNQLLKDVIPNYHIEKRFIKKDGSTVWVNLTVSLVRKPDNEPHYFIGVIEDLSSRKRMEEQLRQALKMEAIGNLAGGIAHEFNNVLGIILGNAELALDDVPDWSPAKESLNEIRTASFRAKEVVRQILSFARKTMTSLKPLEINTIIKESIKLMRASIPTMIEIQQEIPAEPLMILGDPTEIHQMVINLCTNAAHAMKENGGKLEVYLSEVSLDHSAAAHYDGIDPGDFIKLTVKDSGPGIASHILEKVFEPYFTTKDFGEGSGMGLAVVYGLVKKCKGAIHIRSIVGKGTAVEILFPKIEEQAHMENETRGTLPTGTERVLLVDDDESIVKMVQQMLKRLGYSVEAITDSLAALEHFQSNPDKFDIVITDMNMPNMSGDQLAVRLIKVRKDLPILLCTGHSDAIDDKTAKKLGISGFAMKPLDKGKLARAVRAVLDGL